MTAFDVKYWSWIGDEAHAYLVVDQWCLLNLYWSAYLTYGLPIIGVEKFR